MNNATLNRWLKKLAAQIRLEEQKPLTDKPLKVIKVTGDEFKNMIQGPYSFEIGSEQRFVSSTQRVNMQYNNVNFAEELPVYIPSSKYYSSSWIAGHYGSKKDLISPNYIISSDVNLGGGRLNDTEREWDLQVYPCGVVIRDCKFSSSLSLLRISSAYYIRFINCQFDGYFSANTSTIKKLEFENCIFNHISVSISHVNINELLFKNCTLLDITVTSTQKHFIKHTQFHNIQVNDISLHAGVFGDLTLDEVTFNCVNIEPNHGRLASEAKNEFTIFNNIVIKIGANDSNLYSLNDIRASSLYITGVLTKLLFLKNFKLDMIEFSEFVNEGKLRLHNVSLNLNGKGVIADSQLGKAEFNNVNFGSVAYFQVYLSNMTEIITTNSRFPFNIGGRNNSDYREVRETYRQLKYAASKQGDRIRELQYEQLELTAYGKSLEGWKNLGNMVILYTNKLSNNHGQSWELAALWLILIMTLLFIGISKSMDYNIAWFKIDFSTWARYLNFALNPLHDFDKVFGTNSEDVLGKARLLDAISKVASGYLLFQFLRAFRKYVR